MIEQEEMVYFGMYGSGIRQERGKLNGISLPIAREAGAAFESGWRCSGIKIETLFLRASSISNEQDRLKKSRITLVPVARDGVEVPLFVSVSTAHNGGGPRAFGTHPLTAAVRAMKCREDMTTVENCSSSKGDQNVCYVWAGDLGSASAPGKSKVVDGQSFTARFNEESMNLEFLKRLARWLLENRGKAMVMTCLPANVGSMEDVKRILKEETLDGQSLEGIRERSREYFESLPTPTRDAHGEYRAFFSSDVEPDSKII